MVADGRVGFLRRAGTPLALLAVAVLIICFYYAFAYLFLVPYPGVDYDGRWVVNGFDMVCESNPDWCVDAEQSLQPYDQIIQIGDLTYDEYLHDRSQVPFAGYHPGDRVPLEFVRNGQVFEGTWPMLGPTAAGRLSRLPALLLFFPFWVAGTCVLLFLRPRDTRWLLLIAFNYISALWLTTGAVSAFRVAYAAQALGALNCLLVPTYLHFHLVVPSTICERCERYLLPPLYALTVALAILQVTRQLPIAFYNLALLLPIVSSIGLLLLRLRRKEPPLVRLATRLMLLGIGLALGPGLVLWVIPSLLDSGVAAGTPLVMMTGAVALQPFFYIYALYKHRLGRLEFRANRLLSSYTFLILFITLYLVVFTLGSPYTGVTSSGLAFTLVESLVFVAGALLLRAPFQRLIDRLAYGTEHNPDDIIRAFANRIARSLSRDSLIELLTDEIAPSLLIRESALYLLDESGASLFYAHGIEPHQQQAALGSIEEFLARSGKYIPAEPDRHSASDWVRLSVAIAVSGRPLGVWLLGKRDPDDYYPRPDVDLLTTLGNQIGVALENTRLFENLQHRAAELEQAYSELQELDRMKDQFVQNISHELRTPLTIMLGSAELLLEDVVGELEPEQRTILESMADRTRAITRLVNDILTVQQSALDHLEREPVNLAVLAQSCIREAQMAARKPGYNPNGYDFVLEVADDLPPVLGDRARLRRVFDNLLDNSMKFSPERRTIKVEIRSRNYQFPRRQSESQHQLAVEVSITDQGIGIAPDQIDRIWKQFYQVDGSSTRRFGGAGLGLAVAHSIVDVHGGVIWAESIEREGSTFRFVLPALGITPELASAADKPVASEPA